MEVRGRHLVTGLPTAVQLRSEEVRSAIAGPLREILQAIRDTLEQTPPELVLRHRPRRDPARRRRHPDPRLRRARRGRDRHAGATVADSPLTCVAVGSGQALDHLDQLAWPSPAAPAAHHAGLAHRPALAVSPGSVRRPGGGAAPLGIATVSASARPGRCARRDAAAASQPLAPRVPIAHAASRTRNGSTGSRKRGVSTLTNTTLSAISTGNAPQPARAPRAARRDQAPSSASRRRSRSRSRPCCAVAADRPMAAAEACQASLPSSSSIRSRLCQPACSGALRVRADVVQRLGLAAGRTAGTSSSRPTCLSSARSSGSLITKSHL